MAPRTLLGGLIKNKAPVPYVPRVHTSSSVGLSAFSAPTGFEAQMRALETNGTLYAIVQRIIEAVAEVEWCLYRVPRDGRRRYHPGYSGVRDDRVEVVRHPALDLWNQPNPFFTGHAFRETTQQYQEVTGETYWIIVRRNGLPIEMWPVRPDRMTPVPHPTNYLAGYIYRSPDGEEVPLSVDDVVFLRNPKPTDLYRGLSPVRAILTELDSTRQASEYVSNAFRNGARPGGIIQAEQNLSDEEFDQLRARWAESHAGVGNAQRVAILEAGLTWQSVSFNNDEMQLVELKESAREAIREAFGFPKAMMGATDDVNKANAYAGEVLFARWIIKPRLIRMREMLNRHVLPLFQGSAANLEFDFVNPVPEDDEIAAQVLLNKAQAANFLAATGMWEPESITEVCGLPGLEELDVPMTPQIPASPSRPGIPPGQRQEIPPAEEPGPEEEPDSEPDAWLKQAFFRHT